LACNYAFLKPLVSELLSEGTQTSSKGKYAAFIKVSKILI
jgi:hypothetical protein